MENGGAVRATWSEIVEFGDKAARRGIGVTAETGEARGEIGCGARPYEFKGNGAGETLAGRQAGATNGGRCALQASRADDYS